MIVRFLNGLHYALHIRQEYLFINIMSEQIFSRHLGSHIVAGVAFLIYLIKRNICQILECIVLHHIQRHIAELIRLFQTINQIGPAALCIITKHRLTSLLSFI